MRPVDVSKCVGQSYEHVTQKPMTPEQFGREKRYRLAMTIAKSLLKNELITQDEYAHIDTIFARKFSPVWGGL